MYLEAKEQYLQINKVTPVMDPGIKRKFKGKNVAFQISSYYKVNEVKENGRVIRNSATSLQQEHQDMHYRGGKSRSPSTNGRFGGAAASFNNSASAFPPMDTNVTQYSRLQKPRNTIDMWEDYMITNNYLL